MIFGGSQILTINATKFAGFRRNSLLPLCMLKSKTSEVVVLTLFAERYAAESFFFSILGFHQQGFGNNALSPKFLGKWGGGGVVVC